MHNRWTWVLLTFGVLAAIAALRAGDTNSSAAAARPDGDMMKRYLLR